MAVKFIQLLSHNGTLYALDETGNVWFLNIKSESNYNRWLLVTDKRGED